MKQVAHAEPSASDLVLVGWAYASGSCPDLPVAKLFLRGGFDRAVVGKDQVATVGDEQPAIDADSSRLQPFQLLGECDGIQNHTAAYDTGNAFVKDPGRDDV